MNPKALLKTIVAGLLVLQLSGCGTLLYPERRGTESGKLDADIVLLDAVGLLFFIIPGVIAFAIDLATGTIYLPKGEKSRVGELLGSNHTVLSLEGEIDLAAVETAVTKMSGTEIELHPDKTWVMTAPADASVASTLRKLMELDSTEGFRRSADEWRTLDEVVRANLFAVAGEARAVRAGRSVL